MPESHQTEVERALASVLPEVEVLLVERNGTTLRIFIDHPDGVGLDLCQQVSELLSEMRETYALEVSSPGSDRPLTKPAHFSRFCGRRAKIKLCEPVEGDRSGTISGEIVQAGEETITIAADDGMVSLPYTAIGRANLVPAV